MDVNLLQWKLDEIHSMEVRRFFHRNRWKRPRELTQKPKEWKTACDEVVHEGYLFVGKHRWPRIADEKG